MRKSLIYIILSLLILTNPFLKKLKEKYTEFVSKNYFQKIFVHTDKNFYVAGENIWFKIYVYDAKNHKPEKLSKIAYIELIDQNKEIVYLKIIKLKNGCGYGNFKIADSLISGFYQIRCYTNVMRNYPSDFFFTKTIFIKTDNHLISRELWREIRKKRHQNSRKFI